MVKLLSHCSPCLARVLDVIVLASVELAPCQEGLL